MARVGKYLEPMNRLVAGLRLARSGALTLGSFATVVGARYPLRVLVNDLDTGTRLTGEDLARTVRGRAAAHRRRGLDRGVVLVVVHNSVDVLLETLALSRAGAIPAPVGRHLRPAELEAAIVATGAHAAVASDGPEVGIRTVAAGIELPGPDQGPPIGDPTATAIELCTSGTTGLPKAACLSSRGLLGPLAPLAWARLRNKSVLASLPLSHVMGLCTALAALAAGVQWIHRARFDAAVALDDMERLRPSAFVGVPTMYADLEAAGAATRDLSSVQLWVSGADALPEARARRFQRLGSMTGTGLGRAAVADGYGMVELSGPAAVRLFPPSVLPPLGVTPPHRVLGGMEVRAVDEAGAPVPAGSPGTLEFRGRSVLRAYRGRAGGPDAQGWFTTGDRGAVFPGGWFRFVGRDRDRLKIGGFSVFPAEVEALLLAHPHVAEVGVVGLPDDRTGERAVALVLPSDPSFDSAEFMEWSRRVVAGYRRPSLVFQVDAVPRGAHGKIDREAATALAVSLHGGG
jgi:acyl-CoA synthetase (AMP-forming)/AMP-acid ligase II